MPEVRKELKAWMNRLCLNGSVTATQKKELAQELMESTFAEDKFAAMLIYQEFLIAGGSCGLSDLPVFADWFDRKLVYDWSTCDWLCVKVIGPVAVGAGKEGVDAVAGWKDAENMWRRRAACVSFVNFAKLGDANCVGFIDTLLGVCDVTVQTDEKWIQSGTGWVLREVSTASQDALDKVQHFIEGHLGQFSREGLDKALEKLPNATKKRMLAAHDLIKSGGGTLEGITALKAAEEAASKNRRRQAAAAAKSKASRARKAPGGVPGEGEMAAPPTPAAATAVTTDMDRLAASAVLPVPATIPPPAVSAVVPVMIAIPADEPAVEATAPVDATAATDAAPAAVAAVEPHAASAVPVAAAVAAAPVAAAEPAAAVAVSEPAAVTAVPMAVEVVLAAAPAEAPASDAASAGAAANAPAKADTDVTVKTELEGAAKEEADVAAKMETAGAAAVAAAVAKEPGSPVESNKKPRLGSPDL